MPLPAMLLVAAALLPLGGCVGLLFLGRRMGVPLAGYAATAFVGLSFACSGWALMRFVAGGNYGGLPYRQGLAPITLVWTAAEGGARPGYPGFMDFGVYIDSLTVSVFVTITLAVLLLHIFVTRSMRRDPQFSRFFTILGLSCFAVLGLTLCASLLHAFLFLELLGLCGALLTGFRLDRELTARAGARVFVVNRVGDLGMIVGIGILYAYVGKLTWPDLWLAAGDAARGGAAALADSTMIPSAALTLAGVALFFGVAARCAQFPLHVWSSDAAEGVAPAGAMTLVLAQAAGAVVLLSRLFPMLTPSARLLVAIVGATTLLTASLIACVQPGIKQVLTWLSGAQLGLIVLAMGVESWSGATFHLVAYCFFQTLLFLAAGAVIRAARGETRLARFGGLARKMPVTAVTAAIGLLAAGGAGSAGVGLSGFYSRHLILRHAGAFASLATGSGLSRWYWALFAIPVFATGLNAFAMTRWWLMAFSGRPRDRRLYNHAREAPPMLWPVVVLAVMTALAGRWLGVGEILASTVVEAREAARLTAEASDPRRQPVARRLFEAAWPSDESGDADVIPADATVEDAARAANSGPVEAARIQGAALVGRWLWVALVLGIAGAAVLYLPGPTLARRVAAVPPVSWVYAWLLNRMYFDELYDALFVALAVGLAGTVAWVDRHVVRSPARASSPGLDPDRTG